MATTCLVEKRGHSRATNCPPASYRTNRVNEKPKLNKAHRNTKIRTTQQDYKGFWASICVTMPRSRADDMAAADAAAAGFLRWISATETKLCKVPQQLLDRKIGEWGRKKPSKPKVSVGRVKRALTRLGCSHRRHQNGGVRGSRWCLQCKHTQTGSCDADESVDMSADGDEVGNVSNAEEGDATSEVVSTEDAKKVVSSAEEGDATSEFVSTEVATGAHAKKVVRAFVASVDLAGNTLCRIPQDTIDRWYWDWQKKQKTQSVSSRVLRQTFTILGGKKTRLRKRPLGDKDQRIVAWCLRCKHASVWRAQPDSDTEDTDDTEDAQRKDRESEGQNETEPHTPAARNTLDTLDS